MSRKIKSIYWNTTEIVQISVHSAFRGLSHALTIPCKTGNQMGLISQWTMSNLSKHSVKNQVIYWDTIEIVKTTVRSILSVDFFMSQSICAAMVNLMASSMTDNASQTTCQSGAASDRPSLLLTYDTFSPACDILPTSHAGYPISERTSVRLIRQYARIVETWGYAVRGPAQQATRRYLTSGVLLAFFN